MKGHGARHRKAHRAMGGKTESTHVEKSKSTPASEDYGNKYVMNEAKEGLKGGGDIVGGSGGKLARKRGGAVHHKHEHHKEHMAHGGHAHHKEHEHKEHRAHGGKVHHEHHEHKEHMAHGGHAHHRKHRAAGGMVGADKHPYSSANAGHGAK